MGEEQSKTGIEGQANATWIYTSPTKEAKESEDWLARHLQTAEDHRLLPPATCLPAVSFPSVVAVRNEASKISAVTLGGAHYPSSSKPAAASTTGEARAAVNVQKNVTQTRGENVVPLCQPPPVYPPDSFRLHRRWRALNFLFLFSSAASPLALSMRASQSMRTWSQTGKRKARNTTCSRMSAG